MIKQVSVGLVSAALLMSSVAGVINAFSRSAQGYAQANTEQPVDLQKKYKDLEKRLDDTVQQLSWLSRTSPPVGTVVAFAGAWPPKKNDSETWTEDDLGWLLCDGRALDATKHAVLIAALGKSELPNLCGLFLRGNDRKFNGTLAGRDLDADRSSYVPQEWSTAMPRTTFTTSKAGSHSHHLLFETDATRDAGKKNNFTVTTFPSKLHPVTTSSDGEHTHTVTGGDSETRPINAAVRWIIKFK